MRAKLSPSLIKTGLLLLLFIWACGICRAQTQYLKHELPTSWGADTGTASYSDSDIKWWKGFGDPVLDTLIAIGEENNYDVATASRRIAIARAQAGEARSAYFPQLGLSAGWSANRMSGMTGKATGPATTGSYFTGTVTMDWEIDVFGKITSQVKQAKEQVKVSAAEYAGVMTSLDAEIASAYISLMVSRGQLQIAKEHSESQKQIVHKTEVRFETGLTDKLDVAQARTLYYSTIAQIPLLESSIESAYNSLGVLLGVGREGLPSELFEDHGLPSYTRIVATGIPADLLRRRPDIVQAEKSIDVCAAALGIAKKEYLPSLSISGSVGTQARDASNLFKNDSFTYSIAPTLSWTIFDGMSRHYATVAAKENLKVAVDSYNLTVMTAVEEVRNAISRYDATVKYISTIQEVVNNAEEEVRLSFDLYMQGLSAFTNVVNAQLNYLTYRNTLVSAHGQAVTSLIDLYKALGGGWDGSL